MSFSIETLKQFSLLAILSDEDLRRIQPTIVEINLVKDEVLFLEGDNANALYFVLNGWLKAEKMSPEGRQQTLRFIGPGELINELAVFSNEVNAVSVIAMEASRVFAIPHSEIEIRLTESPSFSRAVVRNLAQRIQHLLNHIENLSLYPVEVRLARYLIAEAQDGIIDRPSWKTQSEIANQLGTVLDVFNRNLHKFAKQGYIEINRDQIILLDPTSLKKIAQG